MGWDGLVLDRAYCLVGATSKKESRPNRLLSCILREECLPCLLLLQPIYSTMDWENTIFSVF